MPRRSHSYARRLAGGNALPLTLGLSRRFSPPANLAGIGLRRMARCVLASINRSAASSGNSHFPFGLSQDSECVTQCNASRTAALPWCGRPRSAGKIYFLRIKELFWGNWSPAISGLRRFRMRVGSAAMPELYVEPVGEIDNSATNLRSLGWQSP